MEKLNFEFEGEKYYLIGCRKCQEFEVSWNIGSDGTNFVAQCGNCSHKVMLMIKVLRDKPDEKPIDMRLIT